MCSRLASLNLMFGMLSDGRNLANYTDHDLLPHASRTVKQYDSFDMLLYPVGKTLNFKLCSAFVLGGGEGVL